MNDVPILLAEVLVLEVGECGLEQVHLFGVRLGDIVEVLHSLVEGFALDGSFIGQSWDVAEVLGHFLVDTVGLPYFPTDFEVGKQR